MSAPKLKSGKQENVWLSLLFNIVLPGFILVQLSGSSMKKGVETKYDLAGYDLVLMSIANADLIPAKDSAAVIVAKNETGGALHLRIFDQAGTRVLDKSESEFPLKSAEIQALKARLAPFWDRSQVTKEQKSAIIDAVTSVTRQTRVPFYVIGPVWALIIACALPLGYGVYDYFRRRQINFFSSLGLIVILVRGLFGLSKLPGIWFACSEASVPLIFAIAILWTSRWDPPLVQKFLLNPQVFDLEKLRQHLAEKNNTAQLLPLMRQASLWFAGIMLLSVLINFSLALAVIRTNPHENYGLYSEEIGRLQLLQFPAIGLPLMVLTFGLFIFIFKRLHQLTGAQVQELMLGHEEKAAAEEKP